ncbi:hypothetical protein Gohar_016985 [Gossypium harknessii]|uniref:Uncharacterized protein n=1 Tax=Gossypium harknessii TaxID=34285 RepID=A0A7J9G4V5_9ROSI|nr:hypothetical protein [Gossypium harknessii]
MLDMMNICLLMNNLKLNLKEGGYRTQFCYISL